MSTIPRYGCTVICQPLYVFSLTFGNIDGVEPPLETPPSSHNSAIYLAFGHDYNVSMAEKERVNTKMPEERCISKMAAADLDHSDSMFWIISYLFIQLTLCHFCIAGPAEISVLDNWYVVEIKNLPERLNRMKKHM